MNCTYRLSCNKTGLVYFGSCKDMDIRMNGHLCKSNVCTSKRIIENNAYTLQVLQEFDTIDEAIELEGILIRNEVCVNKCRPNVTKEEIKEYRIKYYNDNKEQLSEASKIYYQNHRDEIITRVKKYQTNNKEAIQKTRELNKDKYKQSSQERYRNDPTSIKQNSKRYYDKNKEVRIQKAKDWYHNNKQRVKDRNACTKQCPTCSKEVKVCSLYRHKQKCLNV